MHAGPAAGQCVVVGGLITRARRLCDGPAGGEIVLLSLKTDCIVLFFTIL
jgi:hypothetical protein